MHDAGCTLRPSPLPSVFLLAVQALLRVPVTGEQDVLQV